MLRNYLKIALRTLRKHVGFTAINVFGLAIGLACCLLLILYVLNELSFDRFHAHADRIYRVNTDIKFGSNDMRFAVSPDPVGPTLLKDYPQVENFVRLHQRGTWLVRRVGTTNNLREENITFADSTLFDVFSFPLVSGDPKTALTEPNTVVISETAARRHFGTQNPLGQSLVFDNKRTFKVTGVMRDLPLNSHFQTHFFLAMRSDDYPWGQWLSCNLHTYILLKPGVNPAQLEKNFDSFVEKYAGPQVQQFIGSSFSEFKKTGNSMRLWLVPLTDIHLHARQQIELAPNGDIQYVYVFSAVAIFILLIACINFMNLATARSANRAREVGVRKVLGSERRQLIGQFMTESVLMAAVAMGLALLFVAAAIPLFNQLAAKSLTFRHLFSPSLLGVVVALPVVAGLLAGSYPALFLSSFRPIAVLKGGTLAGRLNTGLKRVSLRGGLVVFQFITSIVLIVGTLVVYRQLHFIQTKKLGFERQHLLTVNDVYALGKSAETFKTEVLRLPGVVRGSLSGYLPTPSSRNDNAFFPEGKIDQKSGVSMQNWSVDADYVRTLGMQILQGRDFSREFGSDSTGMILNETAVKQFGFTDPIGKHVSMFNDPQGKTLKTYTVIGVVKNFHFESLRRGISPLALTLTPNSGAAVFRLGVNDPTALMKRIEATWKQLAPGQPFSYSFLEDDFEAMYRAEQRVGTLVLVFSVLAILVACLGLFGLAAYMAEQRTKEIGIRKVLGASVPGLVWLLSKDFLKLVFVALLIATPLAWWAMSRWLEDFAYRIDLEWWVFVLAGVLAIAIALLTVSFQSVKAALMNPVKSLRTE
jgi:putative ABC transport system permease protein